MPKQVSDEEMSAVLDAVAGCHAAVSLEEIAGRLAHPLPRRTLQRRLAALVELDRLVALSARGGRRYRVEDPEVAASAALRETSERGELSLSAAAKEIRRNVMRPLSARRPVGYQAAFLGNYRPNVSAYLAPPLRRKLAALGKTTGEPLPAGTYFRKVMDRLLIDLSWNSSRLEGNTYSLLETQRLLELGETAEGKGAAEAQMILNHKAAIELLSHQADEIGFNRHTLCNLHAQLSDNLLPDPAACGRLRSHAVAISGTVFHPLEVPQAIEARFEQILATATAIEDAFEQAFFVMVQLPYLQPFEDVNKRVSRLAANIPLVRHNLSPLSFVDVPQADYASGLLGVYELTRVDYLREVFVWAYERSCARYSAVRQSLGEPDPFRLRHRQLLIDMVGEVVRGGMDKKIAAAFVRGQAAKLPETPDSDRLAAMAETELTSLHEGNFARYRVRPAEFAAWKRKWK
ncbi:MAG: Fic family protein [Verrucomicrobia bacterium]|nr:Fic family protein [Verrucomicrobiota bacterium]